MLDGLGHPAQVLVVVVDVGDAELEAVDVLEGNVHGRERSLE